MDVLSGGGPRCRVLASERRQNEVGEWEDAEPTRARFVVFGQPAENLAESARKGTRLLLAGTLRTEAWADRSTGEKRTGQKLWVDSVAVSLAYAAAITRKITRERASQTDAAAQGLAQV